MEGILADLRFGLRNLLRRPGFTAVALLTLGLGIGANSAIFSVVRGVLLSPLGFPEPEGLTMVWQSLPDEGIMAEAASPALFVDWRDQAAVFDQLVALDVQISSVLSGETPEAVEVGRVSPAFFKALGVQPQLGRGFLQEESPEVLQEVVLSHRLWERLGAGEQDLVGQPLRVGEQSYTVVGVMPRDFKFIIDSDLWLPLVFGAEDLLDRGDVFLQILGRLHKGVTLDQAQAEMDRVAASLAKAYPLYHRGAEAQVVPLREQVVGPIRLTLILLFCVVFFVLAVACANIANLMLARAVERRGEMAVRQALGASRREVMRQSMVESLLLGFGGGLLGIAAAFAGVRALVSFGPAGIPRLESVQVDGVVLFFTLVVAVAAGLAVGILPALDLRNLSLSKILKEGASRASSQGGEGRVRSAVVILEIALALALLIGGGLMVRSFQKLLAVDPGFETEQVLAAIFALEQDRYPEAVQRARFVEDLLGRMQRSPEVQSAGIVTTLPLSRVQIDEAFSVEGKPFTPDMPRDAGLDAASQDYFRTLGISLLAGRSFSPRDRQDSPPVLIVNQRLARRLWPDEDPLGKRLRLPGLGPQSREVVGLVEDIHRFGLDREPRREIYVPFRQFFEEPLFALVLRSKVEDPLQLASAVRRVVQDLDPEQSIIRLVGLRTMLEDSIAQRRFNTWILSLASLVALALAVSGIYGLLAYYVSRQTHELGLRMALGARRSQVLLMVLGRGLRLTVTGAVLGIVGALLLSRFMGALLFEVQGLDVLTFVLVPFLFVVIALAASFLPAWKATQVDPAIALRES
ncbi:MAG: ABC transporter permease [Deltaproteobacteria bacterium]|nr:ABC transporter permease [Deltaproteobacteria bacterium]